MDSLKDKVVIVTGASSGIGKATCVEFAKHAVKMVLTGRNEKNLEETRQACLAAGVDNSRMVVVVADLMKDESIDQIVSAAINNFGTVDVLINNAAKVGGPKIFNMSMDIMDEYYRTNLRAIISLTLAVMPYLKKTKGNVVNISSIVAGHAWVKMPAYSMMKSALNAFTHCMALELATSGVRVNTLSPGIIDTPVWDGTPLIFDLKEEKPGAHYDRIKAMVPMKRAADPSEIAKSIVFLSSADSSYTTGHTMYVDGGFMCTSGWCQLPE